MFAVSRSDGMPQATMCHQNAFQLMTREWQSMRVTNILLNDNKKRKNAPTLILIDTTRLYFYGSLHEVYKIPHNECPKLLNEFR
jgi:hypothetical protein